MKNLNLFQWLRGCSRTLTRAGMVLAVLVLGIGQAWGDQTWDFTEMSSADKTAYDALTSAWTWNSSNKRYDNAFTPTNGTWTDVISTTITQIKDMKFMRSNSNMGTANIRIFPNTSGNKDGRLAYGNSNVAFSIPAEKDDEIKITFSNTNSSAQGYVLTNAKRKSDNATTITVAQNKTTTETLVVTTSGRVEFKCDNSKVILYKLVLTSGGEEPEPECGSTEQAALTLSSSSGTICGTGTTTFTVSGGSGTGALSVSSSDETKATASISSSTVTVTGVAAGSATITVTKACDATYAEKTATYSATVAAVPTADAGADKVTEPETGVALAATAAESGCTGAWTIESGPNSATSQLSSTSSATATFTPTVAGTYTLRWTVTNTSSSCSAYDEMTVTAAVCSISDCGNATLTYAINGGSSGDHSEGGADLISSATASNTTALGASTTIGYTGISMSSLGKKAAAAASACYPTKPNMSGKIDVYNGAAYSSSNYLQFSFTVKTGYTFTPCDIQFTVQPVDVATSFRWEVTNGTNVYGYGTATDVPKGSDGGASVLTGLTSTAEMEAGTYYIRLYPYVNAESKTFRISNNVILKGTTEEVAGAGPSVSSFTPASGATVKTGATVTIAGSTGSTVYYQWSSSSSAPEAATIVSSGTAGTSGAGTVTTTGIASSATTYLYAVAVKDAVNSDVASASYTIDDTAPTLSSSDPANSATDVTASGNIVLTFSESIAGVDDSKFSLSGATIGTVAIDGSDDTKVNVAYTADPSTAVTLTTAAGAVTDAAGNASAALSSISFTTAATPVLTALVPGTLYQAADMANITFTGSDQYFDGLSTNMRFYTYGATASENSAKGKTITSTDVTDDLSTKSFTSHAYIEGSDVTSGTTDPTYGAIEFITPSVAGKLYIYTIDGSSSNLKLRKKGTSTFTALNGSSNYNAIAVDASSNYYIHGNSKKRGIYGVKFVPDATVYSVSADPVSGDVCSGNTATITLSGSQSGVNYQLYKGESTVGDPVAGTGSALTLTDTITTPGTYTVKSVANASYAATTMTGSVTVSILAATSITTQPTTSVDAYTEAEFTLGSGMVVAGGGLSYQWYSYTSSEGAGEAALDGETAATLTATQTDAGTYYYKVKVSGSCGDPVSSNMITVTVTADNTLTYNANGGTGTMSNTAGEGSVTLRANTYTKSGYTFMGWATSDERADAGTVDYADGASYTLSADATLYAVWAENCYSMVVNTSGSAPAVDDAVGGTQTGGTMKVQALSDAGSMVYGDEGIKFNANGDVIEVTLLNKMQAGTIVSFTMYRGSASNSSGLKLLNSSGTQVQAMTWDAAGAETRTIQYKVVADDGLDGSKVFRIGRNNTVWLTSVTVANCAPITYDLTVVVNDAEYGTVDKSSVTDIPENTTTSNSSNTFTVNGTTVTATPTTATAEYTYAFSSWSNLPATVTANATVTATFTRTPVSYTLGWNTNGGSDLAGTPTSGTTAFGTTLTKPTDPTKSNYTFAGWNTANDGSGTNYTGAMTMPAAATTYYAKWTQAVTLNANTANHGSGANQSATAVWNATGLTGFVATAAATDYTVIGYFTDATGGTQILNADGTFAAEDISGYVTGGKWSCTGAAPTLYAQLVESLSVTYNGNGADSGDAPEDDHTYTSESNIMIKDNTGDLVKDGYIFTGWNTAAAGTGVYYPVGATIKINSNTTLYAVWDEETCETLAEGTQNAAHTEITATTGTIATTGTEAQDNYIKISGGLPKGFTVTAKEGKAPIAAGDKLTVTVYNKNKSATDFGFILKTTSHTGSIASQSEGDIVYTLVAGDIEENGTIVIGRNSSSDRYHAVKLERCTRTNKTVTFNLNGHGEDIETYVGVPSGSKIVAPIAPSAVGYVFDGWWEDADCETTQFDFPTGTITADKTLYAKWTPIDYTVTYSAPANSNNYTISVAGGVAGSANKTAHYGEEITLTATPASAAYIFSSWTIKKTSDGTDITNAVSLSGQTATATFTLPAYGVTVEATFADAYTLTYDANGVTADMPAMEYHGAGSISLSATVPTADDCVFLGWNTAADGSDNSHTFIAAGGAFTMPAAAETLYAQWGPKVTAPATAESLGLATGRKATLTVAASTCTGSLSYQWYKGEDLIAGETGTQYTIAANEIAEGDSYAYTCRVSTDTYHSTTSPVITVTAVSACGWEELALITATGSSTATATKDGVTIDDGSASALISNLSADGSAWKLGGGNSASWFGVHLESGFQVGDSVIMKIKTNDIYVADGAAAAVVAGAENVKVALSADKSRVRVYESDSLTKNTDNLYLRIAVTQAMIDAGLTKDLMFYRTQKATNPGLYQNLSVYTMQVKRYSCPGTNEPKAAGNWNDPTVWSTGIVPTINDRVYIDKEITVNVRNAQAKEILIGTDGQLVVNAAQGIMVDGNITKADGSQTAVGDVALRSTKAAGTGALIMNPANVTVAPKATVEQATKTGIDNGQKINQYIGTPFSDGNGYSNWYGSYAYYLNAANNSWVNLKSNNAALDAFKGYMIMRDDETTFWMQGTLVKPTDANTVLTLTPRDGVLQSNLLANSWSGPIDIEAMETTDFEGADATIYLFNAGTKAQNEDAGAAAHSAGQWTTLSVEAVKDNPSSFPITVIPSMQGFIVLAHSGAGTHTVTLNYDRMVYQPAKSSGADIQPNRAPSMRQTAANSPEVLKLIVSGESGASDNVLLFVREDFTTGFDNGWDGRKMTGSAWAPKMYAVSEDGNMAIHAVPEVEGTVIGFRAGQDNNYTFTFRYEGNDVLYLNDMLTETSTRIHEGFSYDFTTADGDIETRFVISHTPFAKTTPTGADKVQGDEGQSVRKLFYQGVMYIIRGGRIYNAEGARIQ